MLKRVVRFDLKESGDGLGLFELKLKATLLFLAPNLLNLVSSQSKISAIAKHRLTPCLVLTRQVGNLQKFTGEHDRLEWSFLKHP